MKVATKKEPIDNDIMDMLLAVIERLEKKYGVEITFNVDGIKDAKSNRNN